LKLNYLFVKKDKRLMLGTLGWFSTYYLNRYYGFENFRVDENLARVQAVSSFIFSAIHNG